MVVQMHSANVVEDGVVSVVNDIVSDHSRELHTLQGRGGEGRREERGGEGRGRGDGKALFTTPPAHWGCAHTTHTWEAKMHLLSMIMSSLSRS